MTTETFIAIIALVVSIVGPGIAFYAAMKVVEARLQRAEADIEERKKEVRDHDERDASEFRRLWDAMEKNRGDHHNAIETIRALFMEVNERLCNMEGLLRGMGQVDRRA